ncbi:hypothetical protein [Streptomyces katsurahamanus]|uniref:Chaplin n=1 Tax=Streptomyces katsurahamanus TaxID=2577098 RepID=A0ABW9P0H0_9ACTN|nr:hypothetical protein [Streptomyces katsurahamanus]MQS38544.1 hypothetical protein [Streptomyces katsurahamanus]
MRIRTAFAALTLTVAGLAAASAAAVSAHDFGDIIITTEQNPAVVVGCNPDFVVLSPSAQCGVYHIATGQ